MRRRRELFVAALSLLCWSAQFTEILSHSLSLFFGEDNWAKLSLEERGGGVVGADWTLLFSELQVVTKHIRFQINYFRIHWHICHSHNSKSSSILRSVRAQSIRGRRRPIDFEGTGEVAKKKNWNKKKENLRTICMSLVRVNIFVFKKEVWDMMENNFLFYFRPLYAFSFDNSVFW